MKSKLIRANMVVVALALLMASFAPAAYADQCSTETVAGDWAFTLAGTILTPSGGVPAAAIARVTFDESGNITNGTEPRNVGGVYADETVTGNWTVNPNCTGTLNVNIYESGVLVRISVVSMTFDDGSAELRGVQKSLTLPDGTNVPVVISLEAHKQHSVENLGAENPGTLGGINVPRADILKEPSLLGGGLGPTQTACYPVGHRCTISTQCCSHRCSTGPGVCCDQSFRHGYCASNADCCYGLCLNHSCTAGL
jgi:hypothetical protein